MLLNLFVVILVIAMAYWWSEQGLFSALIHLLLTVVAAVVALALWEPLVLNMLIEHIPEHAWGAVLLVVFGAVLLGLRALTDVLAPRNLSFHNLGDRLGGAVFGGAAGVITAGLGVIGLQMVGLPSLFGYQAYDLDAQQQPTRESSLWIPVDQLTADVLGHIANGSMSPMLASGTASIYYRDLDVEASLYNGARFGETRRALAPDQLRVPAEEDVPSLFVIDDLPTRLSNIERLELDDASQLVVVATEINLQGDAADGDGHFRANPHQVALAYAGDGTASEFIHPFAYIIDGQMALLLDNDDYVMTPSEQSVVVHWAFRIPAEHELRFIRIKNARAEIPDVEPVTEPNMLQQMITTIRSSD